jgi:putative NIF3 family GTP cyclohydrolase 1 type 2
MDSGLVMLNLIQYGVTAFCSHTGLDPVSFCGKILTFVRMTNWAEV